MESMIYFSRWRPSWSELQDNWDIGIVEQESTSRRHFPYFLSFSRALADHMVFFISSSKGPSIQTSKRVTYISYHSTMELSN